MKIELEEIESCVKKISVEIPIERIEEEKKSIFIEIGKTANVPGFRKGKAPQKILEQRFGRHALNDAAQKLIKDSYYEAVEKNQLNPVGDPEFENVSYEDGKPLVFSAIIEVLPDVELEEYAGAVMKKKILPVDEKEVEDTINSYRERAAQIAPVEGRQAQEDDFVNIDYKASKDGNEISALVGENRQIHLKQGGMLEAVSQAIIGMNKGEEKTFTAPLPKEFPDPELAGADLEFYVKVNGISERILPELDDEFAKSVSEFSDMEGFRNSVKTSIQRRNESMAVNDLRTEVLSMLIEKNPFDLPPKMVERRAQTLAERTEGRFRDSGVDMGGSEYKRENFMERFKENAQREIREEVILASVVRQEKIEATEDELNSEIARISKMFGQPEEVIRKQLAESHGLAGLYQQVVFDKAYNTVVGKLTIEEETLESSNEK